MASRTAWDWNALRVGHRGANATLWTPASRSSGPKDPPSWTVSVQSGDSIPWIAVPVPPGRPAEAAPGFPGVVASREETPFAKPRRPAGPGLPVRGGRRCYPTIPAEAAVPAAGRATPSRRWQKGKRCGKPTRNGSAEKAAPPACRVPTDAAWRWKGTERLARLGAAWPTRCGPAPARNSPPEAAPAL